MVSDCDHLLLFRHWSQLGDGFGPVHDTRPRLELHLWRHAQEHLQLLCLPLLRYLWFLFVTGMLLFLIPLLVVNPYDVGDMVALGMFTCLYAMSPRPQPHLALLQMTLTPLSTPSLSSPPKFIILVTIFLTFLPVVPYIPSDSPSF